MIFDLAVAIRTSLAAILSFVCCYYLHLPQAYWLILAAVMIVQINSGDVFWQQALCLLGTGLVAAILVGVMGLLGANVWLSAGLVFLVTAGCVLVGLSKPWLFLSALLVNFFTVLALGLSLNWKDDLLRSGLILLGTALAMIINAAVWPKRRRRDIRLLLAKCLNLLAILQKNEFATYLDKEYPEKHFYYEKQIHQTSSELLECLHRLRKLITHAHTIQKALYQRLLINLEQIFEIILAVGSLRYQVKDRTTFSVIETELEQFTVSLHVELDNLANISTRRALQPSVDIRTNIEAIEDVNRSALQVVAHEPILFLLFIEKLNYLYDELNQIRSDLVELNTATQVNV